VSSSRKGIAFALGAAVLFGVSAPVAKALLTSASPQLLAGLLYLGSGFGLSLVAAARRQSVVRAEAPLGRRDLPWLSGAILFGGVVGPLFLLAGLSRTPASSTSLLLNLEGVFTAVLAWIVFRENVDRRIGLGMLAIIAGGVLLSWEGTLRWGGIAGPFAIAAACACWAVDNNLTQKVSGGDPVTIAMLKGLTAGSVNTVAALTLGSVLPDGPAILSALLLGFVSYGVSLVLFVLALRHLGTARTGAYFSLAPFVGAAISIVAWRERPTPMFWVAAVSMGIGLWLHLTERHEHLHAHEATEHAHAHVHDQHHQHQHADDDPPGEPHSHRHRHEPLVHSHRHYPDTHHRHDHD
jgi:drug/metabolite transporter (DMT)-like permease